MMRSMAVMVALSLVLAGCATTQVKLAEDYEASQEWTQAVNTYRAAHKEAPGNVAVKSALARAELAAAEYYYQRGVDAVLAGDFDRAQNEFEHGLQAMPDHSKLREAMRQLLSSREAERLLAEGNRYAEAGDWPRAEQLLRRALALSPDNPAIAARLEMIRAGGARATEEEFALTSTRPVTLNFKDAGLKSALEFLARSFGINIIFDEDLQDKNITLFARDIPFRQALDLLLVTSRTFYRKAGPATMIIAQDTRDKRGQYEDYQIRTFQLGNAGAREMADLLRGTMTLQKVVVSEALNTVTVRDRPEVLDLVADLVRVNDLRQAELVLDVEIMEVNRNKADQLGFDYGSTITATFPPYQFTGNFANTLEQGVLTLPAVTFRYFKQNVDAKTLANPKIRVVNGREARIHIGDRVPLRSSTIQDATGQTRTTFEYSDIGIRLNVEPRVYIDNSTLVKMGLEVSTLGQNLGTPDEPAYSIGTRNAQTFMLLRDGETAILGGLIRDEERRQRTRVPGLGQIPLVGALFTSLDDSRGRTDILLTITPRVVRPREIPPPELRHLYSGTADMYAAKPLIGESDPGEVLERESTRRSRRQGPAPAVGFEAGDYRGQAGELITMGLKARNAAGYGDGVRVRINYSAEILEFVELVESTGYVVERGVGTMVARFDEHPVDNHHLLGRLAFRAKRPGACFVAVSGAGGVLDAVGLLPGSAHVHVEE